MVNKIEYIHVLLKNALDAVDQADIQRASDLLKNACVLLKELEKEQAVQEWNRVGIRPNDQLLKEFGW